MADLVKRFDRDGDGKLSVEELADAITDIYGHTEEGKRSEVRSQRDQT